MKKVALTITTLLLAANACTVALADAVPGAVMILDASDNPDHPRAWKNLGEAGGSLLPADKAPKLEEGPIKIARLGINERKAMYYTAGGIKTKPSAVLSTRIPNCSWQTILLSSFASETGICLWRNITSSVSKTARRRALKGFAFGYSAAAMNLASLSTPRAPNKPRKLSRFGWSKMCGRGSRLSARTRNRLWRTKTAGRLANRGDSTGT